ncbi:hypothetical protein [Sphaerochaeta sp.]|jgi:hypothetical protein|uniref:hypothetical protein n=1 Tax=Sphaerochaeta sp. TaxID=1972642 RepID=UPI003D0FE944
MMINETVKYAGHDLDVLGNYIRESPATRLEPAEGGYIEDMTVMLGEYDITELICQSQHVMDAIEKEAIARRNL